MTLLHERNMIGNTIYQISVKPQKSLFEILGNVLIHFPLSCMYAKYEALLLAAG